MPPIEGDNLDGIPFLELRGSGNKSYDENGGSTTREYLVDWDDADDFCRILRGFSVQTGRVSMQFFLPRTDPERPYLLCDTASIIGWGLHEDPGPGNVIRYKKAKVTARFSPRDVDDQNDANRETFVTESRDFGAEVLTFDNEDGDALYWEGDTEDPVAEGVSLGKRAPKQTVTITIHKWINAPVTSVSSPYVTKPGKINTSTTTFLWTRWPEETLLFMGAQAERDFTSDGASAWRIGLSFEFRPESWNKFFDPRSMSWRYVETDNGDRPFETTSFADLFP